MQLTQIRKLISKYNFDPHIIGKVENICIDVCELVEEEKNNTEFNNIEKISEEESKRLRCHGKRTNKLSIALSSLLVGETIKVDGADYCGKSSFHCYAHNLNKNIKIEIRSLPLNYGWTIKRIK